MPVSGLEQEPDLDPKLEPQPKARAGAGFEARSTEPELDPMLEQELSCGSEAGAGDKNYKPGARTSTLNC